MNIVEEHTSDDGLLKLIICRYDDGDTAIGFEGFPWHTHADILALSSGLSEADAIRRFIDDVLDDRSAGSTGWREMCGSPMTRRLSYGTSRRTRRSSSVTGAASLIH